MTNDKQQLQQELQEKVKEGVKPSDIRKLKRSKSADDITNIPVAPPLPSQSCKKCDDLQKQLQKANQDWTNLAQQRVENLKKEPDSRITELEKELAETVKDATEEITRQENEIKQLRGQLREVRGQLITIQQDLKNYERAAEFRLNNPFPEKEPDYNWWENYAPIIMLLGLYALSAWLLNNNKSQNN